MVQQEIKNRDFFEKKKETKWMIAEGLERNQEREVFDSIEFDLI